MNIVKNKNIFFLISLLVIIPGVISLLLWGLKPSIDFAGGSRMTLLFPQAVTETTASEIRTIFAEQKQQVATLQYADKQAIIRTTPIDKKKNLSLLTSLK